MNNFFFHNPTKIVFGRGVLDKLGSELKPYGSRILLVYGGGSIKKNGLYNKVIKILLEHDIEIFEFSGVKPNPVVSHVREGIALVKENNIEAILAVGGGSVMDTGKIIAAGAMVDHDVWDFYSGKERVKKALPVVTVPTLPASGSEMMGGAVITNEETKEKLGAGGGALSPKVSLLDPELTFSVPSNHTAYGAADTLSHILDPYFFGTAENTTVPDSLVETVVKIVLQTAPKVLAKPDDYDGRGDLMWAATIAHNGMLSCGAKPSWYYLHVLEHALSALYNVPHGAGLSVVITGWARYATKHAPTKLAQLGRNVFSLEGDGTETALRTVEKFEGWFKSIKCPVKLKELGITEDRFDEVAENILMNVTSVLKSKNEVSLREFSGRYYSEANGEDIESLLKFEKKRVLDILELCK